jgi:serine/threonine protein kinase
MTPERWQKVEEVLQAALDLPEKERPALLAEVCSSDPELQQEALSLIAAHEAAGDFMEQPALEQDAHVLIGHDEQGCIALEIGPYKIIKLLGGGGMGEVYLAQDQRLGRLVALKILPPYFVSDDARLRRFQTEARTASALNHPNILTIYEVGQSDDIHFIATEYIVGQTIRNLIQMAKLTIGEVLEITSQLLSGLSAAHAAGIIHRDIKPENIMRRDDGAVRILDFGIAKLIEGPASEVSTLTASVANSQTQTGTLLGTIGYISPEQVRGLPVDERTDIWSTGVVLQEMLTGQRPFIGVTNADTIVAILDRTPPPLFATEMNAPGLRLMQQIVGKALSKQSDERYKSAAEMHEDLNAAKRQFELGSNNKRLGIDTQTRVDEVPAIVADYVSLRRRHRLMIPAIVASVVLLIAGVFLYRLSILSDGSHGPPPVRKIYAQMSEAEQLTFVSEQEQRISAMMGDHPVKLNDEAVRAIKAHVDRNVALRQGASKPGVDSLSVIYGRAVPYVPVIAHAFAARRIPIVVGIYLAMFESAYRPCMESGLGAKGLFQFLPQTAQHYGVAHADMCDVNKMAPAAAHYIADSMAELGDDSQSMTLVLLSYNRGAESVRDSLRMLRETDQQYERNFWTLFVNRDKLDQTFRQESAHYVPGFFAVAIIGENPEAFEIATPPLSSLASE